MSAKSLESESEVRMKQSLELVLVCLIFSIVV